MRALDAHHVPLRRTQRAVQVALAQRLASGAGDAGGGPAAAAGAQGFIVQPPEGLALAGVASIFVIWAFAAANATGGASLIPSPVETFKALGRLWSDGVLRTGHTVESACETFAGFERSIMLQAIDQHWREHLAALDKVFDACKKHGKVAGVGGDRNIPRQMEFIRKGVEA